MTRWSRGCYAEQRSPPCAWVGEAGWGKDEAAERLAGRVLEAGRAEGRIEVDRRGDRVVVGPVRVVETEGHPPPVFSVAVDAYLVIAREPERIHAGFTDQAEHRQPAGVDLTPDPWPLSFVGRPGEIATERRSEGRSEPEADRDAKPIEGLDLATDEGLEARRGVVRRPSVGRHVEAGCEEVADRVAHPAAQPGRCVADADDTRIDRSKSHGRTRRKDVGEMETGPARQEAGNELFRHRDNDRR